MTADRFRCLAADAVVVDDGRVLLMERSVEPHEGAWVLPGGMVERGETAREACEREAQEEVAVDVSAENLVGLYDDPDRDPRGNVSAAYLCSIVEGEPRPKEEAARVEWFPFDDLPETGFDHGEMLEDAAELMAGR